MRELDSELPEHRGQERTLRRGRSHGCDPVVDDGPGDIELDRCLAVGGGDDTKPHRRKVQITSMGRSHGVLSVDGVPLDTVNRWDFMHVGKTGLEHALPGQSPVSTDRRWFAFGFQRHVW